MLEYNPRAPEELEGRERALWSEEVELSGPHACDVSEKWWEFREEMKYRVDGSPLLYVLAHFFAEGHDAELLEMTQEELAEYHAEVSDEVSDE